MVRLYPQGDDAMENLGRLVEWLEYNIAIGVEHFYVYDDAQSETEWFGEHPVMQTYIADGYVTYTRLQKGPPFRKWTNARQIECYRLAVAQHRKDVVWFLFADMDEFVRLERDASLVDLLERLAPGSSTQQHGQAVAQYTFRNWFMSGLLADPDNADLLMIEQYLWRDNLAWRTWSESRGKVEPGPPVGNKAGRTKMLVLASAWNGWVNVHEAKLMRGTTEIVSLDDAFLVHYWKQRASDTSRAAIHYYPVLAEQFGDAVFRKKAERAERAGVSFASLSPAPFPVLPTQRSVSIESLQFKHVHVNDDADDDADTSLKADAKKSSSTHHVQSLRDALARLRRRRSA